MRVCFPLLCEQAADNSVSFYWVPGHFCIHGDLIADELARNGSSTPFAGPEPAIELSSNLLKNTVFNTFRTGMPLFRRSADFRFFAFVLGCKLFNFLVFEWKNIFFSLS